MVNNIDHDDVLVALVTKGICDVDPSSKSSNFLSTKKAYLEKYILYNEVQDIVLNLEADTPGFSQDERVQDRSTEWEVLGTLFSSAETLELLRSLPSRTEVEQEHTPKATSILGYDSAKWEQSTHRNTVQQVPKELHQLLVDELERRLQRKCQFLSRCVYGQSHATNPKLDDAKARTLAAVMQKRIDAIAEKKEEAIATRVKLALRFQTYFETWSNLMLGLHELIVKYKLDLEPERHAAYEAYFGGVVTNIHLKLRCLKAELYFIISKDENMKETRASLDAAKRQLAERLTRVDVQLSQYEHIGDEFRRIVRIYEGIMRDIEIVEGDIRRMVG